MSTSSDVVEDGDSPDGFEMEGSGTIQLTASQELEILTGNTTDINDSNCSSIAEFEEKMMGYQQNSEKEEAWVKAFVPPTVSTADIPKRMPSEEKKKIDEGTHAVVEFLLPSRDYFWQSFRVPDKRWNPKSDFAKLLYTLSASPGAIGNILGEQISVTYNSVYSSWSVELESPKQDKKKNERQENLVNWVKKKNNIEFSLVVSAIIAIMIGFSSHFFIGVWSYIVVCCAFYVVAKVLTQPRFVGSVSKKDWYELLDGKQRNNLK